MTGFDVFMSNPSWKAIYDNAPSALLKEYFRFKFDKHPNYWNGGETNEKLDILRSQFTNVEWQYLIDTTENITAKIHYKRMMR